MTEPANVSREAIIAGILFLCLLGLSLMPPLTIITIWLMPIPLIVLTVLRHRIATAIFATIFALALIVLGLNWAAVLFALATYFMGWSMGEELRKSHSPYAPLITGTLVIVMLELVLLALIRWAGVDIFHSLSVQLTQSLHADTKALGLSSKDDAKLVADTLTRIQLLLPAFICTFALFCATLNLYVARYVVKAHIHRPPILTNWRLPYWSVFAYLVVLTLTLVHAFAHSALWWQALNNAQFLLGLVIGIQGLSALWRWLSRYRAGRFWFMLVIVTCAFRLVGSVCVLIGLFDMINDSYRNKMSGRGR